MKSNFLKLVACATALCLLAGCITLSVYPFYTSKDVIYDNGLNGRWVKAVSTNEFWQIAGTADAKSYLVTVEDEQSTNVFEAHLFKLKDYQFIDLLTTNRENLYTMPVHLISKVSHEGADLSLQFLDYGWLSTLIQTNPTVLRHIIIPQDPKDTGNGNMLYLTAETKDLQKFLLKHADDTNAFNSGSAIDLKRVSQ